jgi:hypothetical protein
MRKPFVDSESRRYSMTRQSIIPVSVIIQWGPPA